MNGEYCNIPQSKAFMYKYTTHHTSGSPESEKIMVSDTKKSNLFDSKC